MTHGISAPPPADAYHERAGALAGWALARFAKKLDAWGAYRPEEEIGREFTREDGTTGKLGPQKTVRSQLTRALLVRHFCPRGRADVIGLHTAGPDNL